MSDALKQVSIYTDGACIGNPGPGGYAAILLYGQRRKELSGGVRLTTNNRMEIMAAIVGLEALKERCAVTVYSDSQYLVEAMTLGLAALAGQRLETQPEEGCQQRRPVGTAAGRLCWA